MEYFAAWLLHGGRALQIKGGLEFSLERGELEGKMRGIQR